MTSFEDIFGGGGKSKVTVNPTLSASSMTFHLCGVEALKKWENGKMTDELCVDETGERVKCRLSFIVKDEAGFTTQAPFTEATHSFTTDEAMQLQTWARDRAQVVLLNPRIEFEAKGRTAKDSSFASVETQMVFRFDDFGWE